MVQLASKGISRVIPSAIAVNVALICPWFPVLEGGIERAFVSRNSPSKVAVNSPVAVTMPTFCNVTVNVTMLPGVVVGV